MQGIAIIVLVLGVVLIGLWRWEPRSMLNAGVFGVLLAFIYLLLMEVAFRADWGSKLYLWLTLGLVIGVPALLVIGSSLLVWNGRTMLRNEGVSLSHLLSPLLGLVPVLIVVGGIGATLIAVMGGSRTSALLLSLLSAVSGSYAWFLWNARCTIPYAAVYVRAPKTTDPDVIIVHGSGLIHGRVPPLLASRLDKAIEVFNLGVRRATIIPSGGQGADEPRAEADAMAEYLLERGVPPERILPEDRSTTTQENMQNSKRLIEERLPNAGRVVFVTSNYHVFRTALIARRVGLKAQGIGSHTARYYLPSAVIREFIAILVMYKWWHIVPIGAFIGLTALGAFLG